MGDISGTARLTQTHGGPPALTPFVLLDPAASTVTLHFADSHLDSGTNGAILGRLYYNSVASFSGATQQGSQTTAFDCIGTSIDFPFSTSGIPSGSYVVGFMGSNTPGNTNSVDLTLVDDLTYCSYGTQVQPGGPSHLQITIDLALAVTSFVRASWFMSVAAFILGRYLDVGALCASSRPAQVNITAADIYSAFNPFFNLSGNSAADKFEQWFRWAAWPYLCQCTPGSPTPHSPPNFDQPAPPAIPQDPFTGYTCDESQLCSQMQNLTFAVNAIAARQSVTNYLVNLIQKQSVPFAYLTGTAHAGLTGRGELAVLGILGLSVAFTTVAPSLGNNNDYPPTIWTLGELSLGTAEGWQSRHSLRHEQQLVLDVSGAITRVGYNVQVGCVATITELLMKP